MTDPTPPNRGADMDLTDAANAREADIAAYALGAMPEAEAAEFRARIAADPALGAVVREWQRAASAIPFGLPDAEPSPDLRDRIIAAAHAEPPRRRDHRDGGAGVVVPMPARRPTATVTPIDSRTRSGGGTAPTPISIASRRPWVSYLSIAALLVVSLGLGYQLWRSQGALVERDAALASATAREAEANRQRAEADTAARQARDQLANLQGQLARVSNTATSQQQLLQAVAAGRYSQLLGSEASPASRGLVVLAANQPPTLVASDLPALRGGQVYQLWTLRGGTPVSAGAFTSTDGSSVTPLTTGVEGAQAVAITIEPGPGPSATPTLPIIAVADLVDS